MGGHLSVGAGRREKRFSLITQSINEIAPRKILPPTPPPLRLK
jgi:hypothetical protein